MQAAGGHHAGSLGALGRAAGAQALEPRMSRLDARIEHGNADALAAAFRKGATGFVEGEPGAHESVRIPAECVIKKPQFEEAGEEGGGTLHTGEMSGKKTGRLRLAGRALHDLHTRDHAATSLQEIKGNSNLGTSDLAKAVIHDGAMQLILVDLILQEGLFVREYHANNPFVERLTNLPDELGRFGTGVVGRNKMAGLGVEQPDGTFVGSGFGKTVTEHFLHERIEKRGEVVRTNAGSDGGKALGEGRFERREAGVRQDGAAAVQRGFSGRNRVRREGCGPPWRGWGSIAGSP